MEAPKPTERGADMLEPPHDSLIKTLLISSSIVVVIGMSMLLAIPALYEDHEEADAQRVVFIALAVGSAVGAAVLTWRGSRRQRRLACGIVIGFAVWLLYFLYWIAVGP